MSLLEFTLRYKLRYRRCRYRGNMYDIHHTDAHDPTDLRHQSSLLQIPPVPPSNNHATDLPKLTIEAARPNQVVPIWVFLGSKESMSRICCAEAQGNFRQEVESTIDRQPYIDQAFSTYVLRGFNNCDSWLGSGIQDWCLVNQFLSQIS